ncbi:hypothetical protein Fcan01_27538, partial [Folsomia candida]
MEKLIRVSNTFRGKKLILSPGDYDDFLSKVKVKFNLEPDVVISLEDDHGAEVDDEVFPTLWSKEELQTLFSTSRTKDQRMTQQRIRKYFIPASPASSLPSLLNDVESFKQILESYIDSNPKLTNLISDCNEKSLVDNAAATLLINDFVAKLVELKGDSPSTRDQRLLAKAIIKILPCWRYPETADGI